MSLKIDYKTWSQDDVGREGGRREVPSYGLMRVTQGGVVGEAQWRDREGEREGGGDLPERRTAGEGERSRITEWKRRVGQRRCWRKGRVGCRTEEGGAERVGGLQVLCLRQGSQLREDRKSVV